MPEGRGRGEGERERRDVVSAISPFSRCDLIVWPHSPPLVGTTFCPCQPFWADFKSKLFTLEFFYVNKRVRVCAYKKLKTKNSARSFGKFLAKLCELFEHLNFCKHLQKKDRKKAAPRPLLPPPPHTHTHTHTPTHPPTPARPPTPHTRRRPRRRLVFFSLSRFKFSVLSFLVFSRHETLNAKN